MLINSLSFGLNQEEGSVEMTKQEFIDWLDTVIPLGCSDWEIREEFDDGTILVAFTNVSDEEDDADAEARAMEERAWRESD